MSKLVTKTTLQQLVTKLWNEKIKPTFGNKYENNVFVGENTFGGIYKVSATGLKTETVGDGNDNNGYTNHPEWTGSRDAVVNTLTDRYVSKIRIYAGTDAPTYATGVEVFAVKKNTADKSQDEVKAKINVPKEIAVKQDAQGNKYVDVIIDNKFEEDIYFIVSSINANKFLRTKNVSDANIRRHTDTQPEVGVSIVENASHGWLTKFEVFGRESLTSGTVTSVNGEQPNDQGAVTIKANHIQNEVGNKTVQEEITELTTKFNDYYAKSEFKATGGVGSENAPVLLDATGKLAVSMLPEVATSEYRVFANIGEAETQKATMQNGDVFYTNDTQKKYLVVNSTAGIFGDSYIELEKLNGVTDVTYEESTQTVTVAKTTGDSTIDLSKLNTKVNGLVPSNGEITLTGSHEFAQATNELKLKVNNIDLLSVPTIETTEIDAIIQGLQ